MEKSEFKVYRYRWIMLTVYMFIVAMNQLLWITFAPITSQAVEFYGVSELWIGILSMSFMLVFILVSIPASWIIDTYGIRIGVGIGALMTGAFGFMRGMVGTNFELLLMAQIGIAIGQPFLLNAITKLSARWFPIHERATSSGLGTLAMYIGILGGMVLTPFLAIKSGIEGMLFIYGIVGAVAALIFILFSKEAPPTAPCLPGQEERALVLDGFKIIFRSRNFRWLLLIFFIGLGVFNAVTTWIEGILNPRNISITQAGITGGVMIGAGIIGALVMPMLSDRSRKRVPFIQIALAGAIIGLLGITFSANYSIILVSGAVLGFFLLSSGPIGFQYGAEITYPASEGSSNGLLLLMGQISGIAFIFGMDIFKSESDGSMSMPLMVLIALMLISLVASFRLKESALVGKKDDE
ncbi:MAG: MFS transporter [Bacteroidetes bacterium]|jgi:cyanate permease|nr:MFS transporter [Bacteroidota bacterium]MBT5530990.1 MFS transporter [Cytophagia bacterium]MBT3799883.1 MFS transporter [Bacteroidota bacterium]MBT4339112.1 MFS transporter [Bacteroidota bacterium]MBT4728860.1 MFS transporter [Bacteroidota bacterium]